MGQTENAQIPHTKHCESNWHIHILEIIHSGQVISRLHKMCQYNRAPIRIKLEPKKVVWCEELVEDIRNKNGLFQKLPLPPLG